MSARMHVPCLVSMLGALLRTPESSGAPDEAEREVRGHAAAMQEGLRGLASELYAVIGLASERGPDRLSRLRLELPAAVSTCDLTVDLFGRDGEWLFGLAFCPQWNSGVHVVSAGGLAVPGEGQAGELRGSLDVTLAYDGAVPLDGQPARARVTLDGRIERGSVGGTYSLTSASSLPNARGRIRGSLQAPASADRLPIDLPVRDLSRANAASLCAAASDMERRAEALYELARASALGAAYGVPFGEARRHGLGRRGLRPEFGADEGVTGRKDAVQAAPSLDETGLDLGGPGLQVQERRASVPPGAPPVLRDIRERIGRMHAAARRQREAGLAAPGNCEVRQEPGDPLFGPWLPCAPLPAGAKDGRALPDPSGGDPGGRQWLFVDNWRLVGPFPRSLTLLHLAFMPDVIESGVGEYVSGIPGLAAEGALPEDTPREPFRLEWRQVAAEPQTGRATLPAWMRHGRVGREGTPALLPLERYSVYARAEVMAPRDMEAWVCLLAGQYGRLWINDELACAGPAAPPRETLASLSDKSGMASAQHVPGFDRAESHLFARVRFREGANRLLLCCDTDAGPMAFAVYVCAGGAPRAADIVKAEADEQARAAARAPVPPNVRGWRGQWNGDFPDANPPPAWDLDAGINVLWRRPIPAGHAAPVVAGDRVVTQTEPHGLVCVDKTSGDLLWRRECNVLELGDKALVARYDELRGAYDAARDALAALGADREQRLAALQNQGLSAPQAEQRLTALDRDERAKWTAWQDFFVGKGRLPRVEDPQHTGYGMPTPATDGERVWAKFGTGVAACFDLDGDRKWMVSLGEFGESPAMFSSPLLFDGRLIVLAPDRGRGPETPGPVWMAALHPDTGRQLWRTQVLGTGTPVPVRLTNGARALSAIVSSRGDVVRAEDGKIVCRVAPARFGDQTPTPAGGDLYWWMPGRAVGVRLFLADGDRVGASVLWDRHVLGPEASPAPVVAGRQVAGFLRKGWTGAVEVRDALTGDRVKCMGMVTWAESAGATIPLSRVGDSIFVADDGSSHYPQWPRDKPGSLSVIQAGARGQVIARNRIDAMGGAPAFDGDRIYVRTRDALVCLGQTGDEGRSYAARTVAANLADWIAAEPPAVVPGEPLRLAPWTEERGVRYERRGALPVANPPPACGGAGRSVSIQAPCRSPSWLVAGPFPTADTAAALASLGDLARFQAAPGTPIGREGARKSFSELGVRFQENTPTTYRLDVLGPTYGEVGTVSYYYARVQNPEARTYRLELRPGDVRLWIQGAPVKHQQRVRLPAGWYSLLAEVPVPAQPPDPMLLTLRFWLSDDQGEEVRLREADIRDNARILEEAYAWAHGSEAASLAESLLRSLPGWAPPPVAYRVQESPRPPTLALRRDPVALGEARDTRVEWRDAELVLEGALDLRLRLRNGAWDPVCAAQGIRFEGRFGRRHSGSVTVEEAGERLSMAIRLNLAVQGVQTNVPAALSVEAKRDAGGRLAGAYTGEFQGRRYAGAASGVIHPPWPGLVRDWAPVAPGEHPRLVFRKTDLPALRARMETPEGRAIVARMRQLLDGRFTNGHAAGYGFLYHLTGDEIYARKCRGMLDELLAGRCDIDARYHFTTPNGQLRAGPAIGIAALGYDLGYDTFDEPYRRMVANRLLNHPYTEQIVTQPRHGPGCNHYGAHQGGIGFALLAIRGDAGVDQAKVENWLQMVLDRGPRGGARGELDNGFSRYGYYYEGHHCGRISKTGIFPFVHALRTAAGLDCTMEHSNTQWMLTKWVYEFIQIDGEPRNIQRGMYARDPFPREGMSTGGDFAQGFGFTPAEHKPLVKWVYNHLVEPDPATRQYSVWGYPDYGVWSLATWPIDVPERNPAEALPLVHHDPDPGYFVFRNGWTGGVRDVVVTALLGSRPRHGRGMAQGGSVEVLGMGLRARFPGAFFHDRVTYFKPEKDGSGALTAEPLPEKARADGPPETEEDKPDVEEMLASEPAAVEQESAMEAPVIAEEPAAPAAPRPPSKLDKALREAIGRCQKEDRLTALVVDYSGRCGAPVLVAMTGRMLGKSIAYWMQVEDGEPADVKAGSGAFTKTTGVIAGGRPYFVMTAQNGDAPGVSAAGDRVAVGGVALWFDGEKIAIADTSGR